VVQDIPLITTMYHPLKYLIKVVQGQDIHLVTTVYLHLLNILIKVVQDQDIHLATTVYHLLNSLLLNNLIKAVLLYLAHQLLNKECVRTLLYLSTKFCLATRMLKNSNVVKKKKGMVLLLAKMAKMAMMAMIVRGNYKEFPNAMINLE
jgi:hypothetical protein